MMTRIRSVLLVVIGMVLGAALVLGAGAVMAQGSRGGWGGMMGGDHAAMHAAMHGGDAMPEACREMMMGDAGMMGAMHERMGGDAPMSLEEAEALMEARGLSAEARADCLAHMADHHPAVTPGD